MGLYGNLARYSLVYVIKTNLLIKGNTYHCLSPLSDMCFPPQLTVIVTSRLRSPRDRDERKASREKRATKSREHPKRNIKTSFILRLLCSNTCEFALLLLLLNQLEFPHDRSPVCFWCCYAIRRLGYIASVFCVSLPGKHISLVICVRGHTYHGETHITVTPAPNFCGF